MSTNIIEIVIKGSNQATPALDEAKKKITSLGQTAHDVGKIAAGILAADFVKAGAEKVKEFAASTIDAAKDLGESVNAVSKIFGDNAKEVEDWGRKNSEAFGLSFREFNQAATPLGALLKNTGMGMADVTSNTIELTKRAADMGSVFNKDVGTALEAIQAGLRGESDPLEQFGVSLSAAKVEARALADTGKQTATALTSQELAAARLSIIFDQTSDSAGDFAQTSGQLANATRIANAQIEDAKAKIGEGLLPILAKGEQAVGLLASGLAALPSPVQTTLAAVGTLGAAFVLLVPRIAAVKTAMVELNITTATTRSFLGGPWGIAIGIATAAIAGFAFSQHAASQRAKELSDQLDIQKGAFDDNNRSVIANRLEQEGLLKTAQELGVSTEDLVSAILGDTAARERLNLQTIVLNKNSDEATVKQFKFNQAIRSQIADVDGATASTVRKATATGKDTAATDKNTTSVVDNTDAIKENAKTVAAEFDPNLKLIQSLQDVRDARGEYNKAVREHGRTSAEAREAELKLAGAVVATGTAAANAAGTFNGTVTPALHDILKAGGLTEAQIKDVGTAFATAHKQGDAYAKTYAATASLTVVVHDAGWVSYRAGERNPSGHAAGGPATALGDGWSTIHEQGRELVHLPNGSTVIPAGASQQMMGNLGGGMPARIVLDINLVGAESEFKDFMRKIIKGDGGGSIELAFQ